MDLRYLASAELECVNAPDISFSLLDLSAKGHKGLAVGSELKMEEGQVVTFVLRSIGDGTNGEHKSAKNGHKPTRAQAKALGVEFEDLIKGASKLRARDDPLLTKELLAGLLRVCFISSYFVFSLSNSIIGNERILEWLDPKVYLYGLVEGSCTSKRISIETFDLRAYGCYRR